MNTDQIDRCHCGEEYISNYGISCTAVGYISPPGHNHDDNCRRSIYLCSAGHKTSISLQATCPACDWEGKNKCFCHPGGKLNRWPKIKES